ncbi:MAG TPA: hypothetical protein VHO23_01770 [Candidatus Paceibacterota bacterium]|nr:hypothetical protein [Candidatus Paceibacterota bacterium]
MGKKTPVDEAFFDSWSVSMAYVLGYLYADGNMQYSQNIRGKYVRVLSTDRDRIALIRDLMKSQHTIRVEDRSENRKLAYCLSIGSHALYDALIEIGMTPAKSLTMVLPHIPLFYFPAFVLGYFDGDGCVCIERAPNGNPKRLLSIFTSGSRAFLSSMHERLVHEAGVTGKGLFAHGSSKGTYQLRYGARDSIRLFKLMYSTPELVGLALERKYGIFTKYFNIRGLRLKDLDSELERKGPMVKR